MTRLAFFTAVIAKMHARRAVHALAFSGVRGGQDVVSPPTPSRSSCS